MPRTETKYVDANGDVKPAPVVWLVTKIVLGIILGLTLIWVALRLISPQLNLYRANTEKRAAIAEARAQSDAAEYTAKRRVEIATADAEADRIRAKGIADAQSLIAESLTPEYVRWYYVDKLDDVEGQIIYVPTEGGIPLPEAGRATGGG